MHRYHNISVLGAGTMGHAIAMLLAGNGFAVSLYDPNREALDAANRHIEAKSASDHGQNKAPAARFRNADRIRFTSDLREAVSQADLVFEAAPERLDVKRELYGRLETLVKDSAVIASNTSSYSLNMLAEGYKFADRMVIAHFFNPAHLVPLVELVGGASTAPELVTELEALLRDCGKTPVVLRKDIPGFIANRLQAAVLREASFLLSSGVADAEQIDLAMTAGPGLRWALNGPFEIADYGGLDIWEKVSARLFPELSQEASAPGFIRDKVSEGKLGLKSGEGIYAYPVGNGTGISDKADARDRALQRLLRAKQE
ncbi:3-hydroxyacyl-CoA dehydrogenase family protein [Paenibacillus sp. MBLB4367]|uniref:3-hydroxyacyl-CoA dehydrogenase family protein n=1 Tax=Paenibacillus sp. MBLB4367 TaxID=3384767 RepID=UPI0039081711